MGKLKPLRQEVNLKEFSGRSCTICSSRVMIHQGRDRVGISNPETGRMSNISAEKIVKCEKCDVTYWYEWINHKKKYCLDHIQIEMKETDGNIYIDYSPKLSYFTKFGLDKFKSKEQKDFNVLFSSYSGRGCTFYIGRVHGMPKRNIIKKIKEQAEIYSVFI